MSEATAPKVLFIAGAGRSGSTLLDRVVGQMDGFCSAGEISRLWREGFADNRKCSCGTPLRDCEIWTAILDRVNSARDVPEAPEACALQARVVRPFSGPRRAALRPASFVDDLKTYATLLERLYEAIAHVSGARVVVDSSKEARHGWVLTKLRCIDLRMLHLVRDSRAVVYSWSRRKFDPGDGGRLRRRGVIQTGLEWDLVNTLVGFVGRSNAHRTILRYDDFVSRPSQALERVLELAGENSQVPVGDDGKVALSQGHLAAGNPVRFQRGTIAIRADEEWRTSMSRGHKALVGTLTRPLLNRYGFPR